MIPVGAKNVLAQALELLYNLKTRPMRAQKETRKCYTEPGIDTNRAGASSRRRQKAVRAASLCDGYLWRSSCSQQLAGQADQACRMRSSGPKRKTHESNQMQGEEYASCKRMRMKG